jgi:hypothetical protein
MGSVDVTTLQALITLGKVGLIMLQALVEILTVAA